eukprot:TRINITY_DN5225_c0_g1_i3.p5 TRINITY_DN5225_c0_g1~~TRINITY_DN5225_c0_g1_i3.p5  ORF type:complete len:150 (+),score=41.42 TRINITY_DN5225_c0_g1_i3:25-474(+)
MIIDGRALGSSIYSTLLWRCSVIVTDLFFRMDVQFLFFFFFLMIRRPPRSTHCISSAASDVYKRQVSTQSTWERKILVIHLLFITITINFQNQVFVQDHYTYSFLHIFLFLEKQFKSYKQQKKDIKKKKKQESSINTPQLTNKIYITLC